MNDDKHITDAELQKLLADIHVPAPDENEKISAMNVAESRFEENVKKNEKTFQGNANGSRLMDVLTNTFITLTGGKNMKTTYALAGVLAIGVAGIALMSNQDLQSEFSNVSEELSSSKDDAQVKPQAHEEMTLSAPIAPAAPVPAAAPAKKEIMMDSYAGNVAAPSATAARREGKQFSGVMAEQSSAMNVAGAGASADMAVRSIAPAPGYEIMPYPYPTQQVENRDKFEPIKENAVKSAQTEPVSTFSIDVDTSSYAVMRRALNNGQMPAANAVRTEELINYFDYDYAVPESKAEPFKPTVAMYQTPWNPDTVLMHIGIKGHEMATDAEKPHSNLVFLIDVSGSMNQNDKLPLLRKAFRMLVNTMDEDDTISLVTYAGRAGVALEPTKVADKQKILNAIDSLRSGGGTAGAQGIRTAYELAQQNFDKEGVNRVILATDGDFNVGMSSNEELKKYIEQKRDTGIYLSVLGFGTGNYNDSLMQTLAQNGNGNAAYIDSINEARKVLVDEATSTLYPIANDVKIQVEFNPLKVAEYRLIGYENRLLNREDFNNDKVDAGDIGAGHTVTAIYEVTPVGSKAQLMDDLRYGEARKPQAEPTTQQGSNEYAFLKMRYKLPGEKTSKLITRPITDADMTKLNSLSDDVRFAGAVAAFGQLLRNENYVQNFTYDDVIKLANPARGTDAFNYRGEFINLVRNAEVASQGNQPQPVPMEDDPIIMYQR